MIVHDITARRRAGEVPIRGEANQSTAIAIAIAIAAATCEDQLHGVVGIRVHAHSGYAYARIERRCYDRMVTVEALEFNI